MNDKPLATITTVTLGRWLLLGLPGAAFWVIGGLGALSLLGGLANGRVTPAVGFSATGLGVMWGFIVLCAVAGIVLGMGSDGVTFSSGSQ